MIAWTEQMWLVALLASIAVTGTAVWLGRNS